MTLSESYKTCMEMCTDPSDPLALHHVFNDLIALVHDKAAHPLVRVEAASILLSVSNDPEGGTE
jgi:hypothetical protein